MIMTFIKNEINDVIRAINMDKLIILNENMI
jgi:hypothetical protein